MDREHSSALDDRAVFAREDQGGLDSRAGGEVGQKRGDMLWHLLCALLLKMSDLERNRRGRVQLTGGLAIVLRGVGVLQRRAVDESDEFGLTGHATHGSY